MKRKPTIRENLIASWQVLLSSSHEFSRVLTSYVPSFAIGTLVELPQQWLRATYGWLNPATSFNRTTSESWLPILSRRLGNKVRVPHFVRMATLCLVFAYELFQPVFDIQLGSPVWRSRINHPISTQSFEGFIEVCESIQLFVLGEDRWKRAHQLWNFRMKRCLLHFFLIFFQR
jgi:hypothetical protein